MWPFKKKAIKEIKHPEIRQETEELVTKFSLIMEYTLEVPIPASAITSVGGERLRNDLERVHESVNQALVTDPRLAGVYTSGVSCATYTTPYHLRDSLQELQTQAEYLRGLTDALRNMQRDPKRPQQ